MWLGAALPMGFGAWVPLVAGYRARRRSWIVTGVLVAALSIGAFTVSTIEDDGTNYGGGLIVLAWIVSGAVSFALRRPYQLRMAAHERYEAGTALAERADDERREVLELARRDPARAVGVGVGRPDLPGARHGHVIDVNHADAASIAMLPGVGAELAAEIVAIRLELGCFESVEDLGALMSLHPRIVEAMRTRAVALPD